METITNFKALVAFEKVGKNGSFSKAAEELGVSKAHVSKLVQQLEDQLNQRLINRSTRVVKLTSNGQRLFKACSSSFYNILKAQDEIQQAEGIPHGNLRISLAGAFGEEYITPFVTTFMKKYPRVNVELVFEERVVDLLQDSYDLAIRIGQLKDSSLIAKRIATRREYICATKEYLNLNGTPKSIDDLKDHNCLGPKKPWRLYDHEKIRNVSVKSNFHSNNGRAILRATLENLGLCYLPDVCTWKNILIMES
jgi:DNA-binding transcriptional LysR family regulator